MMRMLSECALIWRGAVVSRTASPLRMAEVVLLALLCVLALWFTWRIEARPAAVFASAVCLPSGIAAFMLWMRLISGAARQNSPANAALVPRLTRRARQCAVIGFGVTMLPVVLASAVFPHGPGFVAMIAVTILLLGMGLNGRPDAIGVFIACDAALAWGAEPLWRFLVQPPVMALCYVLIGLLGWYALHAVFPASGERHMRLYRRQQRLAQGTSLQAQAKGNQSSAGSRPLYRWMLRRDIALQKAAPLLLHALGPGGHRHDFLLPIAIVLALASLGKLAAVWLPTIEIFMANAPQMPAILIMLVAPFAATVRWGPKIASTPGEQALVRLTPRAPACQRFNAVLGRQLLRIALLEWLAGMLAVLGVSAWWGASASTLMAELALMCGALALAGAPLCNLARKQDSPTWQACVQFVLVLLLTVGAYASADRPQLWGALTCATVFVSYLIVSARWRTFMAAPVAFPAGRMG